MNYMCDYFLQHLIFIVFLLSHPLTNTNVKAIILLRVDYMKLFQFLNLSKFVHSEEMAV